MNPAIDCEILVINVLSQLRARARARLRRILIARALNNSTLRFRSRNFYGHAHVRMYVQTYIRALRQSPTVLAIVAIIDIALCGFARDSPTSLIPSRDPVAGYRS